MIRLLLFPLVLLLILQSYIILNGGKMNWDLIWPFILNKCMFLFFLNLITFRSALNQIHKSVCFFIHSDYDHLKLLWVRYNVGFLLPVWTNPDSVARLDSLCFHDAACDAFDNVQVHTTVCNQALSMKVLSLSLFLPLSTVASLSFSQLFQIDFIWLTQGPAPPLDSVDA